MLATIFPKAWIASSCSLISHEIPPTFIKNILTNCKLYLVYQSFSLSSDLLVLTRPREPLLLILVKSFIYLYHISLNWQIVSLALIHCLCEFQCAHLFGVLMHLFLFMLLVLWYNLSILSKYFLWLSSITLKCLASYIYNSRLQKYRCHWSCEIKRNIQ